jgi:hypothetical protein
MVSNTVVIVRKVRYSTDILSERASWKRNLQPESKMMDSREGKQEIVDPEVSMATFRIDKATRRVESVCC